MSNVQDLVKTGDWKEEKHVPVIELPADVKKDEPIKLNVSIGKQISHPNTTEHHIEWIAVYFMPDGGKFSYLVGRLEFNSHGASAEGPNTSTVFSQPEGVCTFTTGTPGALYAVSSCNIHGLWSSTTELKLE